MIDLLFEAAQTWGISVSPGSVSKQIADTEADFQRAQELYIHGEISKEILDREKERTEKILEPLQENYFVATLPLSKKIQLAHANWKEITTTEQKKIASRISRNNLCARKRAGGSAADLCVSSCFVYFYGSE